MHGMKSKRSEESKTNVTGECNSLIHLPFYPIYPVVELVAIVYTKEKPVFELIVIVRPQNHSMVWNRFALSIWCIIAVIGARWMITDSPHKFHPLHSHTRKNEMGGERSTMDMMMTTKVLSYLLLF